MNEQIIDQANGVRVVLSPKTDEIGPRKQVLNIKEGDEVEAHITCNVGCLHKFKGKVKYSRDDQAFRFVGGDLDMSMSTLLKMGATLKIISRKDEKKDEK